MAGEKQDTENASENATTEFMTSAHEALKALKDIACKVDPKGCDGPWCTARKKILEVFAARTRGEKASAK